MDKFKQTVLSDEFVNAVADAGTSGKPINFTTAVASTSVLTDDQTAANSYENSQKYSKDTSGNVSGYNNTDTNTIVISVELNNSGLSADVKVSSIFIYAQYNSKDILVATARLNDPELLPAYNGTPVTLEYELYMTLQKTSNVTVQFNNAGLVTRQEGARIDASAVHITGDETVNGVKSFLQKIKGTIEKADKSDLAAKATQLATSHKIGGLEFDGTQDLTLPGVNAKGNQDTTGLAAKATQLAANRTIKLKGVVNGSGTFDGTQDLTIITDPTITENNQNADLSTFNTAGNFYVYGTLSNSPISSGYGLLQVFKMNGGIVQTFTDLQTEKTYTRTNSNSNGYGSWILNADDSTVVHNSGSQSIAGSLTIPVDNSMINVGNDADLAMVKKQGQGGTLVVGSGKTFRIQKSNNAKILPTDTMTDLMSIDSNGNIRANAFIGSVIGRDANFSDFSVVASDMYKYSGIWMLYNANLTTAPGGTLNNVYGVVNVVPGKETGTGYIEIIIYPKGRNVTYKTGVDRGYISGWYQLAKQDEVVHNTGDEGVDGVKKFIKPIDGAMRAAFVPSDITSLIDLYNYSRDKYGNWFTIEYIATNNRFSDAPDVNQGAYTITIVSRDINRGYMRLNTPEGISINTTIIQGVLQKWLSLSDDSTVFHKSGDETATGKKLFRDSIAVGDTTSASMLGNNGNLELNGTLPYINFHFGKSTKDFTSRIIENSEGQLSFVNATGIQSLKANLNGNADTATAPNVVVISTNTDLNNMTNSGFFSFQAGTVTNSPVSQYFSLNVTKVGPYNGTQTLIDANTGIVWTRSWYSGNKFSDWQNNTDTNVNKILPTDANNVTKSGTYVFNGTNLPSSNDYYVSVIAFDDNKIKQVAMRDYDNATFSRTKIGGVWYDWVPMSTTTPIELSDNYDIKNLTTAGQYTSKSGKMVGLPAYPVWGFLEVMNNGVDIIQRFNITSGDDSHTFYQRAYASGSWKDWRVF